MPMMEMRAIERGEEVLKARAPKAARRMKSEEDMAIVGCVCSDLVVWEMWSDEWAGEW